MENEMSNPNPFTGDNELFGVSFEAQKPEVPKTLANLNELYAFYRQTVKSPVLGKKDLDLIASKLGYIFGCVSLEATAILLELIRRNHKAAKKNSKR
jgi:hypothetical protein